MTMLRRMAPAALKTVLVAVIVFFVVRSVPLDFADITGFLKKASGWFYASIVLFAVFLALQASIWVLIVNAVGAEYSRYRGGSRLRLLRGVRIFIDSQFAKYIPGGFWNYAGRIVLATRAGVPLEAQFASIVYENVLLVAAALVYALMLFMDLHVVPLLLVTIGVTVLSIVYSYYLRLTAWIRGIFVRASRWRPLQKAITKFTAAFGGELSPYGTEASLTRDRFFGYLACFLGSHFVMGIAFWMMTNSFGQGHVSLLFSAGTFATAWLLGLLSPLPGGLGVREGFLVYFLSMKLGTDTAIQISVIARLWNMMAEVLFWMLVQAVSYLTRRVKVYES